MKKHISSLLTCILVISCLVGCAPSKPKTLIRINYSTRFPQQTGSLGSMMSLMDQQAAKRLLDIELDHFSQLEDHADIEYKATKTRYQYGNKQNIEEYPDGYNYVIDIAIKISGDYHSYTALELWTMYNCDTKNSETNSLQFDIDNNSLKVPTTESLFKVGYVVVKTHEEVLSEVAKFLGSEYQMKLPHEIQKITPEKYQLKETSYKEKVDEYESAVSQ